MNSLMFTRCRMASRTGSQWRSNQPRVVRTGSLRHVSPGVVEIESSAGHAERIITRSMDRAGRG